MSKLLLGIDVGTYSSKGVLVETNGTVVKTAVVEHEMSIPHPGWAEQDDLDDDCGQAGRPGNDISIWRPINFFPFYRRRGCFIPKDGPSYEDRVNEMHCMFHIMKIKA
jgi:hypothetical protein